MQIWKTILTLKLFIHKSAIKQKMSILSATGLLDLKIWHFQFIFSVQTL